MTPSARLDGSRGAHGLRRTGGLVPSSAGGERGHDEHHHRCERTNESLHVPRECITCAPAAAEREKPGRPSRPRRRLLELLARHALAPGVAAVAVRRAREVEGHIPRRVSGGEAFDGRVDRAVAGRLHVEPPEDQRRLRLAQRSTQDCPADVAGTSGRDGVLAAHTERGVQSESSTHAGPRRRSRACRARGRSSGRPWRSRARTGDAAAAVGRLREGEARVPVQPVYVGPPQAARRDRHAGMRGSAWPGT